MSFAQRSSPILVSSLALSVPTLLASCGGDRGSDSLTAPSEPAPNTRQVTGTVTLPAATAVQPTDLVVRTSLSEHTVDKDGLFSVEVSEAVELTTLFLVDSNDNLSGIVPVFPDEDDLQITIQTLARGLILTHPALSTASVADLAKVREESPNADSFDSLVSEVEQTLKDDASLLNSEAVLTAVDRVVADLGLIQNSIQSIRRAGNTSQTNPRDPTLSRRQADSVWQVTNPRPVRWGFRVRDPAGTRPETYKLIRRAKVDGPAVTTDVGTLDNGPYNGVLSRGVWTEEFTSRVNLEPLLLNVGTIVIKAGKAWLGKDLWSPDCLVRAAFDGTVTGLNELEQAWSTIDKNAAGIALLGNDVFQLAVEAGCVQRALVNLSDDQDQLLAWTGDAMKTVSAWLDWYGRAQAAYEVGQMIAAMFDPGPFERVAVLEGPRNGGTYSKNPGIEFKADPQDVDIVVDGSLAGSGTPSWFLNFSEGPHSYQLNKTGYVAIEDNLLASNGEWSLVYHELKELPSDIFRNWQTFPSNKIQFLVGAWGSGPENAYVVGANGTLLHFNGQQLTTVDVPTDLRLDAIWGSGPNDVFVVGDGATVLHFDGNSWSKRTLTVTSSNLFDVWGSGPNDVFAVGNFGHIVHYNGTTWQRVDPYGTATEPRNGLRGVWGFGPDDVYAVGRAGQVLHYDGGNWRELLVLPDSNAVEVWGAQSNEVFVTTEGDVWKIARGTYRPMNIPSGQFMWGIHGVGSSDFLVAANGNEMEAIQFKGSSWQVVYEYPPNKPLTDVFYLSQDTVILSTGDGEMVLGTR